MTKHTATEKTEDRPIVQTKTAAISLREVCFSYDTSTTLIENLSFDLSAGELLQITGEAGSGKSTLIRLLTGELTAVSGEGFLFGQPLFGRGSLNRQERRRLLGVIYQDDPLLEEETVFRNIAAPLLLRGSSDEIIGRRVLQALSEVGLAHSAKRAAAQLSSTEQRLISLARIIALVPTVVIADLNDDSLDREMIFPRLEKMSQFGAAVLVFTRSAVSNGTLIHLSGGGE